MSEHLQEGLVGIGLMRGRARCERRLFTPSAVRRSAPDSARSSTRDWASGGGWRRRRGTTTRSRQGVRGPFRDLSWTFPRYYTLAAREFVEEVRELDGALPVEPPADSSNAVAIGFSGPLLLDVSFARSGDNMRTAAAACREAVRRWLGWKRVAMDRTARQGQRDPADTSGTVGWCRVAGARRRSRRDCAEIAPRLRAGRALAAQRGGMRLGTAPSSRYAVAGRAAASISSHLGREQVARRNRRRLRL